MERSKSKTVVISSRSKAIEKFPASTCDGICHSPKRSRFPDWTTLPSALVVAISDCLPVVSAISMGLTCKTWINVLGKKGPASQTRGLPWLMLSGQNDSETRTCFSLLEKRVRDLHVPTAPWKICCYCWGSIQDWLIVAQLVNGDLWISFYNPFSKAKLLFPLRVINNYFKIVMSSPPTDKSFVMVLLHKSLDKIACWTPGAKDCFRLDLDESYHIDEAAFCNNQFYFVTRNFNICTIDRDKLCKAIKECRYPGARLNIQFHHHKIKIQHSMLRCKSYLVESCGELLLVLRGFDKSKLPLRPTTAFEVFKLDLNGKIWKKVESLGDRVLFIGNNDTRSSSGEELGIKNCICFFNDCVYVGDNEWTEYTYVGNNDCTLLPNPARPFMFADWGIFSLDGDSLKSFHNPYPRSWPPMWITAPTWWYLDLKCPGIENFGGSNQQLKASTSKAS